MKAQATLAEEGAKQSIENTQFIP